MKKDIYIIRNDINSKVYIGQAINAQQRFQSHCKPSSATIDHELIAIAIQKYGRQQRLLQQNLAWNTAQSHV